jgi:hypothetical protein
MSNANKSNGTTFNVSNKPGSNGAPANAWENLGNLFMDASGRYGTFYLSVTVTQLEALLAQAKASPDGKLNRKFNVFARKAKAKADSAGTQPQAAA